jgi:hypothetical protein
MSKDQLRFDRAVNTASENMEDWIKDLKVASKTGYLVSETAEEMASAYGDLLDIDGSELSSSFLMDTDNFENLKKALKGDEEAYKALQEAVKNDIEIRLNLDSNEEFQTALADLEAKYLNSPLWNDIEVGATIDDTNFIAGLENMINAANMTA